MTFELGLYVFFAFYAVFMIVLLGFCKAASDQDTDSEEYHVQVLMYLAEQQNDPHETKDSKNV